MTKDVHAFYKLIQEAKRKGWKNEITEKSIYYITDIVENNLQKQYVTNIKQYYESIKNRKQNYHS